MENITETQKALIVILADIGISSQKISEIVSSKFSAATLNSCLTKKYATLLLTLFTIPSVILSNPPFHLFETKKNL